MPVLTSVQSFNGCSIHFHLYFQSQWRIKRLSAGKSSAWEQYLFPPRLILQFSHILRYVWFLLFCMLPVTWFQTAQPFNTVSNHAHKLWLIVFNSLYLRLLKERIPSPAHTVDQGRDKALAHSAALICVFYTSLVSKALTKQESVRCALGWSCYGWASWVWQGSELEVVASCQIPMKSPAFTSEINSKA